MTSVSFRPHSIRKIYEGEYEIDANGDTIPSKPKYGRMVRCRYEQNGRASSINLGDGTMAVYSFTIYLNSNAPDFHYGDTIELFDSNGSLVNTYKVLGFQRSQLNCKVWV